MVATDLGHRHPFAVVEPRAVPPGRASRDDRTARRRRGRRTPTARSRCAPRRRTPRPPWCRRRSRGAAARSRRCGCRTARSNRSGRAVRPTSRRRGRDRARSRPRPAPPVTSYALHRDPVLVAVRPGASTWSSARPPFTNAEYAPRAVAIKRARASLLAHDEAPAESAAADAVAPPAALRGRGRGSSRGCSSVRRQHPAERARPMRRPSQRHRAGPFRTSRPPTRTTPDAAARLRTRHVYAVFEASGSPAYVDERLCQLSTAPARPCRAGSADRDLELVRVLRVIDEPREPRCADADPDGCEEVLDAQVAAAARSCVLDPRQMPHHGCVPRS